jgi:hypothetical protein
MALGRDLVDAIIREHSYKSITGDVLLIGQQTLDLGGHEVLELMREHGVLSGSDPHSGASAPKNVEQSRMNAAAFFRLLGVDAVRTLDVRDVDIVPGLSTPIPQLLRSNADFIVDGGALSDLFSPAAAMRSYAAMLRPGGRLLAINNLSGHFDPYSIPSPAWYLDYFVINGFEDCKVYVIVYPQEGPANAFYVDIDCLLDPAREVRTLLSSYEMAVVTFAEKGNSSTDGALPTHVHRRSSVESEQYRASLGHIKRSKRLHLVRSRGELGDIDIRGGHLFMQTDYTAVSPSMLQRVVAVRSEPPGLQTDHTAVDPSILHRVAAVRGEPQPPSLKILCIGTGRDGTQSLNNMVEHIFTGSERKVMHEYCCREFYQAFCDLCETGASKYENALRQMIDECAYDCVVGNGYAAILPLFAERYGRGLKVLQLRRDDRTACIASLIKNSELFPTAYGYYSNHTEATVKRMAAFHLGEMSRAQWDHLSIEDKFSWYYDKTHALIRDHLSLFDEHMEITTESLNDDATRRAIAEFFGSDRHAPPPKAHLNASVIDIASFPEARRAKMHWLMGRLNIEEVASDEVYALEYFLDKFVAWTGYQIADSVGMQSDRVGKVAADLDRAAKVVSDKLRDVNALRQLIRDRNSKN